MEMEAPLTASFSVPSPSSPVGAGLKMISIIQGSFLAQMQRTLALPVLNS
jgi:hypothetical protein